MSKQELLTWLFPPDQPEYEKEPEDIITNKKFILMSVGCIGFIVAMKLLFSH